MTLRRTCPACGATAIPESLYEQDLEFKGVDLHVNGLLHFVCNSCDYAFESHEQHDANIDRIRNTFVTTRAAFKADNNLLTGSTIREVRKMLDLTQQEAAELFGGGINAFSKYENEEIVQTLSMDRLIRLVAHLGKPALEALKEATSSPPPSIQELREPSSDSCTEQVLISLTGKGVAGSKWNYETAFFENWAMAIVAWGGVSQCVEVSPALSYANMSHLFGPGAGEEYAEVCDATTTSTAAEMEVFGTNPATGVLFPRVRQNTKTRLTNEIGE